MNIKIESFRKIRIYLTRHLKCIRREIFIYLMLAHIFVCCSIRYKLVPFATNYNVSFQIGARACWYKIWAESDNLFFATYEHEQTWVNMKISRWIYFFPGTVDTAYTWLHNLFPKAGVLGWSWQILIGFYTIFWVTWNNCYITLSSSVRSIWSET